MFLAEKLWEGSGKTLSMVVKDVGVEGPKIEFNWTGKLKGVGKAAGIDVTISFTGLKVADGLGGGPTSGQGIFFTKKGYGVAVKSSGYGRPNSGRGKSIEIWSFAASTQDLAWLNTTAALVTIEGDDRWKEFTIEITRLDL